MLDDYYIAVLDADELNSIPSFLEPHEYVVSGVASFKTDSVNLLFANGQTMQIAFKFFMGDGTNTNPFKKFDISYDGQEIIIGKKSYIVSDIWNQFGDQHIIRGGECTIR